MLKETQFDVIKQKRRKWIKGRGGAESKEINATGAHTHTHTLPQLCTLVCFVTVGTWSPAALGWASLEQYHQIRYKAHLPTP